MTPLLRITVTISAEPSRDPCTDRAEVGQRLIDAIHAKHLHRPGQIQESGTDRFGFCEDTRQYAGEE